MESFWSIIFSAQCQSIFYILTHPHGSNGTQLVRILFCFLRLTYSNFPCVENTKTAKTSTFCNMYFHFQCIFFIKVQGKLADAAFVQKKEYVSGSDFLGHSDVWTFEKCQVFNLVCIWFRLKSGSPLGGYVAVITRYCKPLSTQALKPLSLKS